MIYIKTPEGKEMNAQLHEGLLYLGWYDKAKKQWYLFLHHNYYHIK